MDCQSEILSRKQAAAFLGVCLSTLGRTDIPKTKVRDRVIYLREDVLKWVAANKAKPAKGKK